MRWWVLLGNAWVMAGCTVPGRPGMRFVDAGDGSTDAARSEDVAPFDDVAVDDRREMGDVEPVDGAPFADRAVGFDADEPPDDAPADRAEGGVDVVTSELVDAPMDDASLPDVPDVPDVAPDVPAPTDTGNQWHLVLVDTNHTPWRSYAPSPGDLQLGYCPAGQVLVGFRTFSSLYVSGLAPWCARLDAWGGTGGAAIGDRIGGTHDDSSRNDDALCGANEVVVRVAGAAGPIIDRMRATCAPVTTWLTTRALGLMLRQYGDSNGGPTVFEDTCPDGYIGTGIEGSTREYNDPFGVPRNRLGSLRLRCTRVTDR